MISHLSKTKLLSYLNQRNLFWLLYLLLISGMVFSFPNGLFVCERSPDAGYCEETLGGWYFTFPGFWPLGIMIFATTSMWIASGFHYLFYDLLGLGWEYPFTPQPYGERISTLPLIGWLILLIFFYIYAKILFWIMKSIFYVALSLIKRVRDQFDSD